VISASTLGTLGTPALLPMRTVSILLSTRVRSAAFGNQTSQPCSRHRRSVVSSNIRNTSRGLPPRRWMKSITSLCCSR
jgi:hypothetical protein